MTHGPETSNRISFPVLKRMGARKEAEGLEALERLLSRLLAMENSLVQQGRRTVNQRVSRSKIVRRFCQPRPSFRRQLRISGHFSGHRVAFLHAGQWRAATLLHGRVVQNWI